MVKEVRTKEEAVPMAKEEDAKFGGLVEDGTDRKKRVVCCSGSVKKASSGGSVMRCCQAEKCTADLNESKQYHRRHKVCEHHSKAQIVVVAGIKQRFCQQCSKFHELSEFDETKRSCRKRLAGHNERRRKHPSEANSDGSSRKVEDRGRIQIGMQDKHAEAEEIR